MMAVPLLTTKLYIPPPRPNLVTRPRLIQRLDQGLRLGHKLTLVCAPAGFGKTTLITEWVCNSPREVAWLSLDEGDNDPAQFLHYLIAAFQQVDPRIGRTTRQLLQSPQVPPIEELAAPLINDVAATATPLTLVLDDYYLVTRDEIHRFLGFFLENQPPALHVVIGTREDPPLSLPTLRARGQLTEVRERELRFTVPETTAFLDRTMGLALSPQAVQALETRTEGWIAGLQLAALALQERAEETRAETFAADFAGDDRYVVDYLVAEVLERQTPATRDFMRQTAILDRLTAPLCDAVTGLENSQVLLEQLEAANLFLIPLDRQREWYRYYHLFAEVLRTTLDRETQMPLHQRAARWYERHGFTGQAIRHALAYASASNAAPTDPAWDDAPTDPAWDAAPTDPAWDDAGRLVELAAEETIQRGGFMTVRGWLEALPDERVRANGTLAIYKGWVLAAAGELDLAEEYAAHAEGPDANLGRRLMLRCFIALGRRDYAAMTQMAAGALQVLDKEQAHWRLMALWMMAEAQERTGHIAGAIDSLREAAQIGRALDNQVFGVVIEASLASALNLHGQRRAAVAVCEQAIQRYTDPLGQTSPMAALLFSRLGVLHYEANQLDLAHQYHERGVALGEKLALGGVLIFSLGALAPTLYARGEVDAALAALQGAHQLAPQEVLADNSWLFAAQIDLHLRRGDPAAALRWVEMADLPPDQTPDYLRFELHLSHVRAQLAQGRLPDARRRLARLERFARKRGLYRWLITVHILQALTAERSGDHAVACELLSRALEMAAPEDYCRAFLDEGKEIAGLLQDPDVRRVAPAFVSRLLEYAGEAAEPAVPAPPLVEPLSERELEVLRLIAAGLSNREIAQELVIALGTVKRHINNIYGKLDVRRRTQAIAKARELRLLG